MNPTESIPSFDLIVSLDRSDRTASLALLEVASGRFLVEEALDGSPETMDSWWRGGC
jgi:hypothetical protein